MGRANAVVEPHVIEDFIVEGFPFTSPVRRRVIAVPRERRIVAVRAERRIVPIRMELV